MTAPTVPSPATGPGKVFVLVHGSFHGAWAFERLAPLLTRHGHLVVAQDLAGHGLRARIPAACAAERVDADAMTTEPSPLADVTLADWVDPVVDLVTDLRQLMPDPEIVVLGHSVAGMVLNAVGEAAPDVVDRLVYLAAFMAPSDWSANDCLALAEFSTSLLPTLLVADPVTVGAFRINPRSSDPEYRDRVRTVLAADVDDDTWAAVTHLLTPDTPAGLHTESVTTTANRWGSIPRTCIHTTADRGFPLDAQRHYVRVADATTPENPTDVREVAASHSAYWSQPERIADILLGV